MRGLIIMEKDKGVEKKNIGRGIREGKKEEEKIR